MKKRIIWAMIPILMTACTQGITVNGVSISEDNSVISLQNKQVRMSFDLQTGYYQIIDKQSKIICVDSAYAQVSGWKTTDRLIRTWKSVPDTGGQSLLIESADAGNRTLLLQFSLQNDKPYLILSAGIDNISDDTLCIHTFMPLAGGRLFGDNSLPENLRILDGNGGAERTAMRDKPSVTSRNNMMIFFGEGDESRSIVLGGVTYNEFNKFVQFGNKASRLPETEFVRPAVTETAAAHPPLSLYAGDAVGKRVDPGTVYLPEGDRFYLDCVTKDPFASLETYGRVLSEMQNAHPEYYYFPSICLWYAMKPGYGKFGATNDSPGAVEEMQRVKDSGWLKYTKMAIRLVPDCYEEDNENGWWDDEHWQMHGSGSRQTDIELKGGHYREPYETTAKWAQAVTALGGIPLIYFQTGIRSRDYAEKYPGHMLFNEPYHKTGVGKMRNWDWDHLNQGYTSYDFTDEDFSAHMREVYRNLNGGGVRGLMYDYPSTGWALFGGMDDPYATAGSAYRRVFQFARDGLGADAWLHERNLWIGSDIALGIVSSQRIWGDTDIVTPEMIARGGLRWYKNRVAVCYDMDAKNLLKAKPDNRDGLHKLLTMSYTAGSRLLLANSFSTLNREQIFALSRIFPYHSSALTARPVDMLSKNCPGIYSFRINDDWQQVVFYNQNDSASATLSAGLSDKAIHGGLELSAKKQYYVYDFWNRRFIGKLQGNDRLIQELRPGEARMMSVRAVENHPQILSTDRHLLQGYIELSDIVWDKNTNTLNGKAQLVENEPMTIVIAPNGLKYQTAKSEKGQALIAEKDGLLELVLKNETGGTVEWTVGFGK